MQVERHVLADELADKNPAIAAAVAALDLPGREGVSHVDFKRHSAGARAVVRTGECTPYANIILVAGVVF
jgi:D-ribose pyranase